MQRQDYREQLEQMLESLGAYIGSLEDEIDLLVSLLEQVSEGEITPVDALKKAHENNDSQLREEESG